MEAHGIGHICLDPSLFICHKALAHPTRLFIVDQLAAKGEMCVCELTNLIGDDISTVSRHLSVLKSSGILSDDKRGVAVYYSLRIKCAQGFLECAESVMKHDLKDRDSARR